MSETRKLVCDQLRPLNRDGLLGLDLDETGVGDGGVVAGRGDGDDLLGPGPVVQLEEKTRNGILCTPSVNSPRKQRMSFRTRSVTNVKISFALSRGRSGI